VYVRNAPELQVEGNTGVAVLDPASGKLTLYDYQPTGTGQIGYLALGKNGVWVISGDTEGVNYIYNLNVTTSPTPRWQFGPYTNGLIVENRSSLWITGAALTCFNPSNGQMTVYPLPAAYRAIYNPVWVAGKLWALATTIFPLDGFFGNALMAFDPLGKTMTFYGFPKFPPLTGDGIFEFMTADALGNLWVAGADQYGNGLARFNTQSLEFTTYGPFAQGPMATDSKGNVYFATYAMSHPGQLFQFSPSAGSLLLLWSGNWIHDMAVDGADNVWFITQGTISVFKLNMPAAADNAVASTTTVSNANLNQTSTTIQPSTYAPKPSTNILGSSDSVRVNQITSSVNMTSWTAPQTSVVNEFPTFISVTVAVLFLVSVFATKARRLARNQPLMQAS
jgi:streptogramin lyase